MKRIIFLLVLCSSVVSANAQLTEVYPTSSRYRFLDYSYQPSQWGYLYEGLNFGWGNYDFIYMKRVVFTQKYTYAAIAGDTIYGIAVPFKELYCRNYDGPYWHHMMNYFDTSGSSVFVFTKDERFPDSNTIHVVKQARIREGRTTYSGNYFKINDSVPTSAYCDTPFYAVIEVYFDQPYIPTDSIWIGTNLPLHSYVYLHDPFIYGLIVLNSTGNYRYGAFYMQDDSINSLYRYKSQPLNTPSIPDTAIIWGGAFPIVAPQPVCMKPYGTTVDSVGFNFTRLRWELPVGAEYCRVEYGQAGFTPGTGAVIDSIFGEECTLTGLADDVDYDVYASCFCSQQLGFSDTAHAAFSTPPLCGLCFDYDAVQREGNVLLHWRMPDTATFSEVEYGHAGFEEGHGTLVSPLTPTAYNICTLTLDSLDNGVEYEFRLRNWCSHRQAYSQWLSAFGHALQRFSLSTAVNDSTMGYVTGAGQYLENTTLTVRAVPRSAAYSFRIWDDGVTTNPRSVTVTQDTLFTAIFSCDTCTEGFDPINGKDSRPLFSIIPNPAGSRVNVIATAPMQQIDVVDMKGRQVYSWPATDATTTTHSFSVLNLPKGVYMVIVTTPLASEKQKLIVN